MGKTDLQVTPIGLGCGQFVKGKGFLFTSSYWNSPPQEEVNKIVKITLDGGINWFDTAEMYGWGSSEQALATALGKAGMTNGDVVIATKWFPVFRTARNIPRTIDKRI